jgi:hypothetical protein
MTVYAFGLEEHSYTGSGTLLSSNFTHLLYLAFWLVMLPATLF